MYNKNHFSHKSLAAATKVKYSIDITFNLITGAIPQPAPKDTIDSNIRGWKNAETFALAFKVNRKELQSAFKYYTNKGINEYQTDKKIEAACILLSKSEMTIKEIAAELDYHQDYFSCIFKKHKGVTPTEWQKREWQRYPGIISQRTTLESK